MSFGLVFCIVDHYTEVSKDTGQVLGLGQRTGNVPSEKDKVLDDFFTNVEQMEKIETQLQNLWIFLWKVNTSYKLSNIFSYDTNNYFSTAGTDNMKEVGLVVSRPGGTCRPP